MDSEIDAADLHRAIEVSVDERAKLARHDVETVVVSGGGTQNVAIMDGLRERLTDVEFRTVDEFGVPSESKEALMIARVLAGWNGIVTKA